MSLRTKRWRYIEWQRKGQVMTRELYDHTSDPGEYRNLAELVEFTDVCRELSTFLKNGQNILEQ